MTLSDTAIERAGKVFERADLGDPRRVRRAVSLATALARQPQASLPTAWETEAELEAGYRFLRSSKTEFEELMEPFQFATQEAAQSTKRVLVLHDTTNISCPSASPDEVGYLQTKKPGFFVHHALAIDEFDRAPLGILWSQLWGRAQHSRGRSKTQAGPEFAKLKERESDRWLEGVAEAQAWAESAANVVHVMDREGDSYRLLHEMDTLGADFVVRLRHNRRTAAGKLFDVLEGKQIRTTRQVRLSKRVGKSTPRSTHKSRLARDAQLDVTAARVELEPPRYVEQEALTLNVVRIVEHDAPAGASKVEWLLATSLPIRTKADLERIIDIYRARWVVEEFHKALKTGCMFEKRQLESFESLTTLLALSYPIACELLRLRTRARDTATPADEVMRKSLLDCLRAHPSARAVPDNATAEQALLAIAGLGGHQRCNGPPGWQTLAKGYQKLITFEAGWLAARANL